MKVFYIHESKSQGRFFALQRIHEAVERRIAAGGVSGAVSLVARDGKVIHFEAQGLSAVETGKPMTTDAIFRLASMSKPVTGVATLMLAEEARLRLNDPALPPSSFSRDLAPCIAASPSTQELQPCSRPTRRKQDGVIPPC